MGNFPPCPGKGLSPRRRAKFEQAFARLLEQDFEGRIAAFDLAAAGSGGRPCSRAPAEGRPIDVRETRLPASRWGGGTRSRHEMRNISAICPYRLWTHGQRDTSLAWLSEEGACGTPRSRSGLSAEIQPSDDREDRQQDRARPSRKGEEARHCDSPLDSNGVDHSPRSYFKSSGGGMSGIWISMLTLLGSTPVPFSIQ